MLANPQLFIRLSINFCKRNNPIETTMVAIAQTIYNMVTLKSRMKLMKYNYMLAQHKLQRMQETLVESENRSFHGHNINKIY